MSSNPDPYARAYIKGIALARQGQLKEAATQFHEALQSRPHNLEATKWLGDVLCAQGRLDEAISYYHDILQNHPDHAIVHYNLGVALQQQGRVDEAAASYEQALAIEPRHFNAWTNLGHMRQARGDLDGAVAAFQQALQLKPDFAELHVNLANAHSARSDWERAEASLKEALRLNPHVATVHNALGIALASQNKMDEAMASFLRAIELNPQLAEAHSNLGIAWDDKGYLNEALACYEEALRLNPDYAKAHISRGLVLLLRGEYEQAWAEYEWRWTTGEIQPRQFAQPRWDGSPLAGRTILLHAEQGIGDTILFLRYAPLIQELGGRVLVDCQPALAPLATTCPGIDIVASGDRPLSSFDVFASLSSLPGIFGTTLDTIPARIPYLSADPVRVEHWRQELAHERRLKVGIVWQGNSQYKADRDRSVPLTQFAPLADVPGVVLLSLQFGEGADQLATAALPITDLGSRAVPLENLAAVLVNLNLLISVDTAPAHLAGALGLSFWLALSHRPYWPWLLGRSDSPWYPTARLFRQRRDGDWTTVFAEMAQALRHMAETRAGAVPPIQGG